MGGRGGDPPAAAFIYHRPPYSREIARRTRARGPFLPASRCGRVASKGKATVDVTDQSCGVCGGALSPEGECTICGTKHELGANGTMVPVRTNGPPRSGSDNGLTKWLSGEAGDSSLNAWLGGPSAPAAGPGSNAGARKEGAPGGGGGRERGHGGGAARGGGAGRRRRGGQSKENQARHEDRGTNTR